MCKFNKAWIGTCQEEPEHDFCKTHKEVTCSICGKQATKECEETMGLVCGIPVCDNPDCQFQHLVNVHSYALSSILEGCIQRDMEPYEILIAKVHYNGLFGFLNKDIKGKYFAFLLETKPNTNEVIPHLLNRFTGETSEETYELFKGSFGSKYYSVSMMGKTIELSSDKTYVKDDFKDKILLKKDCSLSELKDIYYSQK